MIAPVIQVYKSIMAAVEAGVALGAAGPFGATPPNVRYRRFRNSTSEEIGDHGCLALDLEGDEAAELLTSDEQLRVLSFAWVLDYPTPLEADDVTGLESFTPLLTTAMALVTAETSPVRLVADTVQITGFEPDPESGADTARLIQHATVIYRVLADDPTTLLHQGMDSNG